MISDWFFRIIFLIEKTAVYINGQFAEVLEKLASKDYQFSYTQA